MKSEIPGILIKYIEKILFVYRKQFNLQTPGII